MPIFGHIYGQNSAIFGPTGLQFYVGAQETFIHRLVLRNPRFDA